MSLADVTEVAPVRRMSVGRGTLTEDVDETTRARAADAASLAIKAAPQILAHVHAVQATHVDVLWTAQDGATDCTVTVQAFARQGLDALALMGLTSALVAARKEGRIEGVHVVQSVG